MGNSCNAYKAPVGVNKKQPQQPLPKQPIPNTHELPIILKQKQESIPTNIISTSEPTLNTAYIKYTKEEKERQLNLIKQADSQSHLSEILKELNVDLLEKLSKQDINITCFVKCFKLETESPKSDEELIQYFNETKDNLVTSFKNSVKEDKGKNLDDNSEFLKYKVNFEKDKAKVRTIIQIVSEYRDQMIFQMLTNHTSIFSELAHKIDDKNDRHKKIDFFKELRSSIEKLHGYYFDSIECKDKAKLEQIYHAYLNEEYNMFCLFHNLHTTVTQVMYTEFKPTEFKR